MYRFSQTAQTGQLPEKTEGITEDQYKRKICASALMDWGYLLAGARPPENCAEGMIAVANYLGIPPTNQAFLDYADTLGTKQ